MIDHYHFNQVIDFPSSYKIFQLSSHSALPQENPAPPNLTFIATEKFGRLGLFWFGFPFVQKVSMQ